MLGRNREWFLIAVISVVSVLILCSDSTRDVGFMNKWTAAIPAFFTLVRRKFLGLRQQRSFVISKNSNDVKFLLYSVRNPTIPQELIFGDSNSIYNSNFESTWPVAIIIHGFLSNHTISSGVRNIKNAYLEMSYPLNIIMVDHGALTSPDLPYSILSAGFYFQASRNVPSIGRKVSDFILFLLKTKAISSPQNIHIIGQSIGAHIAGIAGRALFKMTGVQIHRITGLDPAGPMYHLQDNAKLLDKTDAEFVDITHTNQWIYGMARSSGHVDFYVNGGGPFQPRDICRHVRSDESGAAYCSHVSSVIYFTKSIKHPNYIACKCKNCRRQPRHPTFRCSEPILFGQPTPSWARGNYYVHFKL